MEISEQDGLIIWDSGFETGIDRIDFEHKIFLELLNSFKKAIDKGKDPEELCRIISEIEKYAEFHFISEENFMARINYPDYRKHKIEHFELLEQFNLAKFASCGFSKFHDFLKHWFIAHTTKSDIRLKEFIIGHKLEMDQYYYQLNLG